MKTLRKGFTLIELLIAILLLMIVMLMISRMFTSAQQIYRTAAKRASVYSQGRIAMDVIETDLSRIDNNVGLRDLVMASQYVPQGFNEDDFRSTYVDLPFVAKPDSATTQSISPILAFITQTSWQLADGTFQNGKAQVIYYLRKRPVMQAGEYNFEPATAYLMRRVVPVGSDLDYAALLQENGDKQTGSQGFTELPLEEEVASSVLEVRIWAYNNGAAAYMAQTGERVRNLYGFLTTTQPTGITALLRDKSRGGQAQQNTSNSGNSSNGPQTVQLLDPQPEKTYSFGSTAGGQTIGNNAIYVEPRGNYPLAIGIELTIADDKAEILDGEVYGTVRTIRRVISLPGAQPTVSMPEGINGIKAYEDAGEPAE